MHNGNNGPEGISVLFANAECGPNQTAGNWCNINKMWTGSELYSLDPVSLWAAGSLLKNKSFIASKKKKRQLNRLFLLVLAMDMD